MIAMESHVLVALGLRPCLTSQRRSGISSIRAASGPTRAAGSAPLAAVVNVDDGMGTIRSMHLTGRRARLARRWLAGLVLLIASAAGAIASALPGTPLPTVNVARPAIPVGATAPRLSPSRPAGGRPVGRSPAV